MKKLTRKLFVSIMTLVLTVMALGTSTFAWFSMNTTATATGMQVTAKSNATYLLIGSSSSIATTKTGLTDTIAATADDGNGDAVYPAYFATGAETNGVFPGTMATGYTAPSVTANKWYTASNRNSNNATNAVTNVQEISAANLGNYVLTYTTYLTLSADSEDFTGKLQLTSTLVSGDAAASMVVLIGSEYVKLTNGTAAQTTNDVTIAHNGALLVTMYVYIDGTSTNVNSDYINTPNTITGQLSLQFDLVFPNA